MKFLQKSETPKNFINTRCCEFVKAVFYRLRADRRLLVWMHTIADTVIKRMMEDTLEMPAMMGISDVGLFRTRALESDLLDRQDCSRWVTI